MTSQTWKNPASFEDRASPFVPAAQQERDERRISPRETQGHSLRHSLTRLDDGKAAGPMGALLDLVVTP